MIDFITQSVNLPFTISIVVIFFITLIEVIAISFGISLSQSFRDSCSMDFDGCYDLSGIKSIFAFLGIGRVPVIILIILFLLIFGLVGWLLEAIAHHFLGIYIYTIVAVCASLIATVILLRFITAFLAKFMPKDETQVISEGELIGKIATITLGKASRGKPAQAKIRINQQTIYIMVEPDNLNDIFKYQDQVMIVRKESSKYFAIPNELI